jgi:outer membrane protein assembly factor BamB
MGEVRPRRISTRGACFCAALLLVASCASADDWPRWRGPGGDGICREKGLMETWPKNLTPLWTAEVGRGYAGPVAQGGRAYCFSTVDGRDTLTCYDARTGDVAWSESYEGGWTGNYPGTRATPYIEKDRIYTFGGNGDLVARDLKSGKLLWRLNVLRETRTRPQSWAAASNPLIDGNTIYVQTGSGGRVAVGVDKNTGQLVWRAQEQAPAAYAHPILADVEGRKQLIVYSADGPLGIDPANGRTIWRKEWKNGPGVNASDPIYRDGHLFITAAYGQGSAMLRLTAKGAQTLWESDDIEGRFQPAILDGDHLYVNSEGTLKCLKWPEKNVLWATRRQDSNLLGLGGSMVRFGKDRMILLSQSGRLTLGRVTPQGFEQLTSIADAVEGSEVWAAPAIHNGLLFLKGQNELACFDIKAK